MGHEQWAILVPSYSPDPLGEAVALATFFRFCLSVHRRCFDVIAGAFARLGVENLFAFDAYVNMKWEVVR